MDSKYNPKQVESSLYEEWLKTDLFTASVNKSKKPFSIILPPPNANGNLHLGHAMFTYEDILIRFNKMMGKETLWLLGLDHAGIETQFVFEKHLKKLGKSRFDYTRDELYRMIWEYVQENKNNIKEQLKRLGFALDWSREKFTMDPQVVSIVYKTFKRLFDKGLVYRADRLVNYCTNCGTSFSDLEVVYKERQDPLYYMKYGPFTLATVRPETKFGDTAVAVHPKDKRYKKWIGQELTIEGLIGPFKVRVVADEAVDPKFGTGAVKVTPAHDFADYDIAQRHNLPMKQVIGFDGKLNEMTGKYAGMRVYSAREQVVKDLKDKGMMVKIDETYTHRVGTCYRCGRVLEPLPKEQWFIKVKPLADKAKKLISDKKTRIYPLRFKKRLITILDSFIDWNISRQVVWGIRIPAYKCKKMSNVKSSAFAKATADEQKSKGDWFVSLEKPDKCLVCGKCDFKQDEDTFDTWFSSAQWPFVTLQTEGEEFYRYFYPTSVMETGHDILRAWVARMMMIGFFETGETPFETVFLHGMVRDAKGQKMSKSKGNVIDPIMMIDKYGADALRAALIFGTKEGGDVALSEQKVVGMRNFCNKVWNIGRFINMNDQLKSQKSKVKTSTQNLKAIDELKKEFQENKKSFIKLMKSYHFSQALGLVYEFIWHRFADYYIEQLKQEVINGNIEALEALKQAYLGTVQLLHPFMPYVTDAVWQVFKGGESYILQTQLKD